MTTPLPPCRRFFAQDSFLITKSTKTIKTARGSFQTALNAGISNPDCRLRLKNDFWCKNETVRLVAALLSGGGCDGSVRGVA